MKIQKRGRRERGRVKKLLFKSSLKGKIGLYLFIFLITVNLVLAGLNMAKAKGLLIPSQPKPLVVDNTIDLDDLTIEQKIAQMVIVLGVQYYAEPLKKMQLGGIHLHAMQDDQSFREIVKEFQEGSEIPFFITVDLEGCINPFANFREFRAASEVDSVGEAFEKGKTEGKFLKEMGVSIDFAPVVDLDDQIWKCRSFPGDANLVSELANSYILGMQDEGILATAKHYPGKTLIIKDPHKFLAAAEITEEDLLPYQQLIEKGSVRAIMVSHLITYGEVNSEGKPSDASKRIIDGLRNDLNFNGLIITDEINMLGMRKFYDTSDEMYLEVFKAGPDLVLNFNKDPNEIYRMIQVIKKAVEEGEISEKKIEQSVTRILEAKGLRVKP